MKRIRAHKAGFTLIEMLVVLAIMGMILAISVPAFDAAMKTSKVSEGAKLIYKTLDFARHHAITHGTETMVVFDNISSMGNRTGYKIFVENEGDVEDWTFLFTGVTINSNMDTKNIGSSNDGDGDGNVNHVTFNATGTPEGTATITVEDSNDDTCFRSVTCSSASGHVRLFDLGDNPDD